MDLLNRKILFIGGKGGVGKTTTASALAYHASQLKRKTLLVSTDPAHSTSDIFQNDLSGGQKKEFNPYLDIIELNPDLEVTGYLNEVKSNLLTIVSSPIILEEIDKQIDLARMTPGAEESALFYRFSSILVTENKNYEHLIFDTAPSGHTLRMLSLPHLMGVWIEGLLKRRMKSNKLKEMWNTFQKKEKEEDPVLSILEKRKEQFIQTHKLLTDKENTAVHLVMIPEKLSLLESKKAFDTLKQFQMNLNSLIINRVLPTHLNDPFFKNKVESEQRYIKEIQNGYPHQTIYIAPMLNEEIYGIDSLNQFLLSTQILK